MQVKMIREIATVDAYNQISTHRMVSSKMSQEVKRNVTLKQMNVYGKSIGREVMKQDKKQICSLLRENSNNFTSGGHMRLILKTMDRQSVSRH